jgi:prepilin-type N-terminal cleavage/methylation domain-containing protein
MPPDRPDSQRLRAFTLIELLTVIAILAVLGGLAIGSSQGAKQRSLSAQARAELAQLAQELENFKRRHGDYPRQLGALASGSVSHDLPVIDPWGNAYLYFPRSAHYLLFSAGPDGARTLPDASGRFPGNGRRAGGNADNLFADELP